MARWNASSDHRPIPVSASGVMLEEKMVPNGVGTGRPPAYILATAYGMAGVAIADRCQIAATLDQRRIKR